MDQPVARPAGKRATRDAVIGIRLTREALAYVDQLAAKEDRTRSDMLRILLRDGIEHRKR